MTPVLREVQIEKVTWPDLSGCLVTSYSVQPMWDGVDRPNTGGYSFNSLKLAERFAAAYRAGVLFLQPPTIATDVNGDTYVQAGINILCRHAAAELRRLGF